jgi:hypothetical protein
MPATIKNQRAKLQRELAIARLDVAIAAAKKRRAEAVGRIAQLEADMELLELTTQRTAKVRERSRKVVRQRLLIGPDEGRAQPSPPVAHLPPAAVDEDDEGDPRLFRWWCGKVWPNGIAADLSGPEEAYCRCCGRSKEDALRAEIDEFERRKARRKT